MKLKLQISTAIDCDEKKQMKIQNYMKNNNLNTQKDLIEHLVEKVIK